MWISQVKTKLNGVQQDIYNLLLKATNHLSFSQSDGALKRFIYTFGNKPVIR